MWKGSQMLPSYLPASSDIIFFPRKNSLKENSKSFPCGVFLSVKSWRHSLNPSCKPSCRHHPLGSKILPQQPEVTKRWGLLRGASMHRLTWGTKQMPISTHHCSASQAHNETSISSSSNANGPQHEKSKDASPSRAALSTTKGVLRWVPTARNKHKKDDNLISLEEPPPLNTHRGKTLSYENN